MDLISSGYSTSYWMLWLHLFSWDESIISAWCGWTCLDIISCSSSIQSNASGTICSSLMVLSVMLSGQSHFLNSSTGLIFLCYFLHESDMANEMDDPIRKKSRRKRSNRKKDSQVGHLCCLHRLVSCYCLIWWESLVPYLCMFRYSRCSLRFMTHHRGMPHFNT